MQIMHMRFSHVVNFFFEGLTEFMPKSAFTDAHRVLVRKLMEARKQAGIHQADLAATLGKDQSFISNIERGQRRVDMIEFYVICEALKVDPVELFADILKQMPKTIHI